MGLSHLASSVGAHVGLVHMSASLGFARTRLVGLTPGGVVLSCDEVDGAMARLLMFDTAVKGRTRRGGITAYDESGQPQDFITSGLAPEECRQFLHIP